MAHYKTFFKSQRPVRVLCILIFFLDMIRAKSSNSRDKEFVFIMLAYKMTPSISSVFFGGSPWETKRSENLSEARSLLIQPKAVQCFPFIYIETFAHFLKNPGSDQPCQNCSPDNASLAVVFARLLHSNTASGSSALEFGRLITKVSTP